MGCVIQNKYIKWGLKISALYGLLTFIYIETNILAKSRQSLHIGRVKVDFMIIKDARDNVKKAGNRETVPSKSHTVSYPSSTEDANRMSDFSNTQDTNNSCPRNRLSPRKGVNDLRKDIKVKCQQHRPSKAACIYAKDYFAYDFNKWSCGKEETLQICNFDTNKRIYQCDYSICGFSLKKEVFIHVFDPKKGTLRQLKKGFRDSKRLTRYVMKYGRLTIRNGFPFMFISCGLDDEKKAQLLVLNSSILHTEKILARSRKASDKINLNFIFLDSISRAHFYRSLKETVSYFSWLNENSKQTEVLDFQLFQSIHGHTIENMIGLMTGKLLPNTTTDSEREEAKTELPKMLEFLVKNGYQTLYQEDMCWQGLWGMNSDLGLFKEWKDLYNEIKTKSFIGDAGLTFASCKIINMYDSKMNHIFNTDEKICFNGLNMDTYFLRYLKKKITNTKSPLFSFTSLNIAHDPTGKRVQGMDLDLKDFVEFSSQLTNTLTVFFADHGNSYNDYVYTDIEGRYEMYHPTLFIMIPSKVQTKLGPQIMHNMRKNQNRLLNLIDIHHTIKHVVDRNHPKKGILDLLSENRTCANIPMSMPNLCVCDGWDSPVENKTDLMPFVEFAIGHINNLISNASPTMRCKRLVPTSFQNVMQQKHGDDAILKFDIITLPGAGSRNNVERVSVEISYKISDGLDHFDTKLISYDRISKFGDYRTCSDADPKFRYCVCNMEKPESNIKLTSFQDLSPVRNDYIFEIFYGQIDEIVNLIIEDKVGLSVRKTLDNDKNLVGVTFEAISLADVSDTYEIIVKFKELDNMKLLRKGICKGVVRPNSMTYLCTIARKVAVWSAKFSHDVIFQKL